MLDVTIVVAVHSNSKNLLQTLKSIQCQSGEAVWKCLVIANGGFKPNLALNQFVKFDPRFSIVTSPHEGLTQALIYGCRSTSTCLISRIDVGDVMTPERLQRQVEAFKQLPELVLTTSHVEVCGPNWETLWINRGSGSQQGEPWRVDSCTPEQGIAIDIPHHASVMFSRSAYEAVGGYRPEFYFGQDWDLWYRLAGQGTFVHIPEVLTRVRLFPGGISSRHWREQRAIAELSLACHVARSRGESELPLLQKAAAIGPKPGLPRKPLVDGARAEGAYFIAEALRRNRDRRCWRYFREALCHGFWKPRIWIRAIQSVLQGFSGSRSGAH